MSGGGQTIKINNHRCILRTHLGNLQVLGLHGSVVVIMLYLTKILHLLTLSAFSTNLSMSNRENPNSWINSLFNAA